MARAPIPGSSPDLEVSVRQSQLMLDFRVVSSLYDLKYEIETVIDDKRSDKLTLQQVCRGTFDETHELDEWRANDSKLISEAVSRIANRCIDELWASIGIVGRLSASDDVDRRGNARTTDRAVSEWVPAASMISNSTVSLSTTSVSKSQ